MLTRCAPASLATRGLCRRAAAVYPGFHSLKRFQSTAAPASSTKTASAPAAPSFTAPQDSKKFGDPDMTHFRATPTPHPLYEKPKDFDSHGQSIWSDEEIAGVKMTHVEVKNTVDRIALFGIKTIRIAFDIVSGYLFGRLTVNKILRRILFLETAAGIPGMVAGSVRHLRSLRLMRRDRGWIHTLLEEAENERMHMLIFMHTYNPGLLFRACVLVTQGVFWNVFFFAYLLSPRLCHRFVGYLEEEAVRTYTHILHVMDSTDPKDKEVSDYGKQPATDLAKHYWRLKSNATMRDVILAVRQDEANHRDVNHAFAGVGISDKCPFEEKGHKH